MPSLFLLAPQKGSLRARIIAGLFVANIVFSFSFTLPYWLIEGCTINPETQLPISVHVYTSYEMQTAGRSYRAAGVFSGKFYMACCEFTYLGLRSVVLGLPVYAHPTT